ncbi:MAG TPA: bestrophin family ion channel [Flavipsychrobacter sp.]|nr:bestrophin family ion channel [Flavipsychrobacter sp.]
MRSYNPKEWYTILFHFHKGDTIRGLSKLILIISVYSLIVALVELHIIHVEQTSFLRNVFALHGILGLALSLLLVFRTNTAYDRWWEGRKLWGALVNNSRNLALKMNAILPEEDEDSREFFRTTIPFYAQALKDHLMHESTRYVLDSLPHPELKVIMEDKHTPNQVAKLLHDKVMSLYREGALSGEQLLYINPEILSFTDICGACERIKNTPIPYSYSSFIKKFIFLYIVTLPIGYVFQLGYYVVPVSAIVFYVLGSLELIAEEIEDPFGTDENDLPMEKISANIKKHVAEII